MPGESPCVTEVPNVSAAVGSVVVGNAELRLGQDSSSRPGNRPEFFRVMFFQSLCR